MKRTRATSRLLCKSLPFFAILAAGVPLTALAQTTDVPPASPGADQEGQEIVVTGFRRSLQAANARKRDADIVSDGISAEDIGKFPDQNLASAAST